MKKVSELLKPYLEIIFGALLFLFHFNWLAYGGGYLALGIVAVVLSVYFVVVGILSVALGDHLPKNVKNILTVVGAGAYALFLGTYFLIGLIYAARAASNEWSTTILGPNGWTIAIVSIAASYALGVLLILAFFLKKSALSRITMMFGAIFVLALLVDILLVNGNAAPLGEIIVLQVILYATFVGILFQILPLLNFKKEKPVEEKKEEQPAEEAKAE